MILEIRNLIKRYNDVIAVDNANLDVKEGDIFGLLGPNGAGKTTIINAITGTTKTDGGEIRIFGKNLKSNEREIKREIGVVPQDLAIYEDLTAYENLDYFGRLYGFRGRELKRSIDDALEFTGLSEKKKQYPKKFSGGMKRRLNIACSLVQKPRLIIMDEPTVGIDPQSRNHILESVKELNKGGATIIYTSHYMEEVEAICSYIAIMDHGRIIAKGTKNDLEGLVSDEDNVVFELSSVNFTIVDNIKRIPDVRQCVLEEKMLKVTSKKGSRNLSRLIDCISETDAGIIALNIEKTSLENVFLTLTGRSLRD